MITARLPSLRQFWLRLRLATTGEIHSLCLSRRIIGAGEGHKSFENLQIQNFGHVDRWKSLRRPIPQQRVASKPTCENKIYKKTGYQAQYPTEEEISVGPQLSCDSKGRQRARIRRKKVSANLFAPSGKVVCPQLVPSPVSPLRFVNPLGEFCHRDNGSRRDISEAGFAPVTTPRAERSLTIECLIAV